MSNDVLGSIRYLPGMREWQAAITEWPAWLNEVTRMNGPLCWALIDMDGIEVTCIQDFGHDDGIHENRNCPECDGSGRLPPISQERLTSLLMEYPDADRKGIDTLIGGAPCLVCQPVEKQGGEA